MHKLPPLTITITQDFITQRDSKPYGTPNRRDAEILEHYLIQTFPSTFTRSPYPYNSDLLTNQNHLIDVKYITSQYFNVPSHKVSQYKKSIHQNKLTHFLFYKTQHPIDIHGDTPLQSGNTVQITDTHIVEARTVIKNLMKSYNEGYYYRV